MPVETGRTTARKIIHLPSSQDVSIPVITKINFVDASDRYQETQHTIDNTSDSNRTVHVDAVHPTIGDTSQSINVERIDVWNVLDPSDRYQETQFKIDNVTGSGSTPPHFSNHVRTHVVRYYADPNNPNDSGTWVDSELIDEIAVLDPSDRYQETIYTLRHTDAQADPLDPDISDAVLDPPYRLDPFQNIVNWHIDTGGEPFFTLLAWISDLSSTTSVSGAWVVGDPQASVTIALETGYAYMIDPPDIDIRFVDQFFEPHTYDTTAAPAGTGDIKGYTWYEWDFDFSPSPGNLWFDQLQAYKLANPSPRRYPNNFDFPSYGFTDSLKPSFDLYQTRRASGLTGTDNPIPVVRVRFTVLGPVTTDNPTGRY